MEVLRGGTTQVFFPCNQICDDEWSIRGAAKVFLLRPCRWYFENIGPLMGIDSYIFPFYDLLKGQRASSIYRSYHCWLEIMTRDRCMVYKAGDYGGTREFQMRKNILGI